MLRAQQAVLLAVPEGEQNRSPRRASAAAHMASTISNKPGHAAGVVVGAVVDVADGAVAVAPRAVADVVVVGADDDHLAAKFRVAAGNEGEDVPPAARYRLVVAPVSRPAAELEPLQLRADVAAGGQSAPAADVAPPSMVSSASTSICRAVPRP